MKLFLIGLAAGLALGTAGFALSYATTDLVPALVAQ